MSKDKMQFNKTLIGINNTLYLKSEITQHYFTKYNDIVIEFNKKSLLNYYNIISKFCDKTYIFITYYDTIFMYV